MNSKKLVFSILLAMFLALGFYANPTGAMGIANDSKETEKIKNVINTYFSQRYESEKNLALEDLSKITTSGDPITLEWLKLEHDRQEIKNKIAETFDTRVLDYTYTLHFQNITINGDGTANVNIVEDFKPRYKQDTTVQSEITNSHTITLSKNEGKWLISFDNYEDEVTKALKTTTKQELLDNIQQNHDGQFGQGRESGKVQSLSIQPNFSVYSYNRSNARTFADNNAYTTAAVPQAIKNAYQSIYGQPYPSNWSQNYRLEGSTDCTNFVSQSIFEGTGYTSGDANYFYPTPNDNNWYYKFSPNNSPSDMIGKGSGSWINVGSLYNFLTTNSSRGPYGHYTGTLCNLSSGDVVLMKSGGQWQHAVIISYINSCTYSATMYVDAHTNNVKQVPLANYSLYSWYPVVIDGYLK